MAKRCIGDDLILGMENAVAHARDTVSKQLLKLARKDAPGHNLVVSLDGSSNVVLAEEDTNKVFFRLLPESLDKIHVFVTAELLRRKS